MTDPTDERREGARRVPLSDWDAVVEHLERFCAGGEFEVDDGRAVCRFANARLAVSRDGTVETGMPLHAFARDGVDALAFDHDRGELTVATADGDRSTYTFRRP
ncbi:hypothetical protein [Salinilacihabitans rarus]|uniref:hypothetical protein n=1 Tax=Salinilacihabitans rarus TaxID=2961596 RepID=UPI0020C898A7|nr:hypothetical protein [Salinilacihabitans rarus]